MNYIFNFLMIMCLGFSANAQTYTEVAKSLGIEHTYLEQNFGGGLSFYDFDNDGWDDLTIATSKGDSIHFYKNVSGTFQKMMALVTDANEVKQMLWADVDNDGDKDLFTAVFDSVNYVYINDGSLNFTAQMLPNPKSGAISKTFAAAFGDYDVDGDLDLFVCHRGFNDTINNQLLQNDGLGNFIDVTSNYFFDSIYQPTFCVAFFDYNRDGLPDIYTAEDRINYQNQFYKNIGGGAFENRTDSCGAGFWMDGMGLSITDYNHDGHLDMYVSNGPSGNPLFHNNGNETFTDTASFAGVAFNKVSWGSSFLDYDNDMDMDLHVCATAGSNGPNKNGLFSNLGNGTFADVTASILSFDSTTSFSSATGDFNNDGYPDIAINNVSPDSFNLWQNSGGGNNWLKVKLEGTVSNRDGIGSWIEVYVGGQLRTYYTLCGTGFQAQNSNTQIFGLANHAIVDSIKVYWLSGIVDKLENIAANQVLTVIEGQVLVSKNVESVEDGILLAYPNPFQNTLRLTIKQEEIEGGRITVYNSLGILIYEKEISENQVKNYSINTSAWTNGIYFIHIDFKEKPFVKRIIKNR